VKWLQNKGLKKEIIFEVNFSIKKREYEKYKFYIYNFVNTRNGNFYGFFLFFYTFLGNVSKMPVDSELPFKQ